MSTVIRRVNQLLDSSSISAEQLREVVEEYRAELVPVNARLAEAADLVNRGLRSEAMAIIGKSPSLLDQANALDLSRVDELTEMLDLYSLPPLVLVDNASVELLGDAMVELQSIDGLLRRQRYLVLARAPLAGRLRTLRAIAEADPTSPHWIEDVIAHEKARLEELATDVQAALQSNDQAALVSLRSELAVDWKTDRPDRALALIDQKLNQLKLNEMQAKLLDHARSIQFAFDQFDEANCRGNVVKFQKLRTQITQAYGASALPDQAALIAKPGIEYVVALDAENVRLANRVSAVAKLESVMDRSDATVAQIESAYQKAVSFDEPLSAELFNRYRSTIGDMQTRGKRRFQLAVGGVIAASLLAMGLLFSWQFRRNHANQVAGVAGQLKQLLDAGRLSEVEKFINAMRQSQPKLAAEPKVGELIAIHESMTQAETERAKRFAQQLGELEQLSDESLDPLSLSRLENEAVTEDEKLRLLKQQERQQKFFHDRQTIQTNALVRSLKAYGDQLSEYSNQSFEEATQDSLQTALDGLDRIQQEIKDTAREFPWASSSAQRESENQLKRFSALRVRLNEQFDASIQSRKATEGLLAATSLSELRKKLEAFNEELPSHKRATSYRETLDAAEFWDSADSWNRHLKLTGEVFMKRFDAASLALVRESDNSIKKELSETPFTLPTGMAGCIDLAEKRREILIQLNEFLDQTLFSQVIAVTQKDGNGDRLFVYYDYYKTSRDKFENGEGSTTSLEVIQTGEGAIGRVALSGPLKIDREPASVVLTMQAELKTLHDSALADWDGVMLGWLARLPKSQGLDSTVGEIFTSQLLDRIRQGSIEKERLEELSRSFIERREKWSDWYRKGVRSTGPSDLLKQSVMPELATIYRSRRDPTKELATLSKLRISPIGVWRVTADASSDASKISSPIQYWRSVDPLQTGTLLTIRRDPNNPLKGQWIRLGKLERGNLRISRTDVAMTAAQPVFLSESLSTDLAFDPNQKLNAAK